MLGQLPSRYRFPRNAPPFEGKLTGFLFLEGDLDANVLAQMSTAMMSGSLGWVVIPVAEHAMRAIRKAAPLLMQVDFGSIGTWGLPGLF